MRSAFLQTLGGEAGCKRLSAEFYARVGKDPVLRPLFPGKSLRCATEEFAAFLIQFLGGDDEHTQKRWWLSLRESHARFQIGFHQQAAWLKHMGETLEAASLDEPAQRALRQFFAHTSRYVMAQECTMPEHPELAARWTEQRLVDDAVTSIVAGHDQDAIALAKRFASRSSILVGLLGRMIKSGRVRLIHFVTAELERQPCLATHYFSGRTLLHFASGAGRLEVVSLLLRFCTNPDIQDHGGHTPLYYAANECASDAGPPIVRALVQAGADVNACAGITRSTSLHMAARRGHLEIARMLLDYGAAIEARDRKGITPLRRAMNCRRDSVAELLVQRGARLPS